jgi:hypothetical protein
MQNSDCTFIAEQFTEYQENSLPSEVRAKVDTHLASCSSCMNMFENLSGVIETLHNLPTLSASKEFNSTLLSRIDKLNQENVWQKIYHSSYTRVAGYAIAAGLVVAIGINMLIDPISPMKPGVQSNFAGEQYTPDQQDESLAEASDSSANHSSDSLKIQNTMINSQNQSMQLVSGKK